MSLIEYRYLNLDENKFYPSDFELNKSLEKGSLLRAIPNWKHNQVLYAGSKNHFTETEAIVQCRLLEMKVNNKCLLHKN